MTANEELRKLLDERGVEWEGREIGLDVKHSATTWKLTKPLGKVGEIKCCYEEHTDGKTSFGVDGLVFRLTPQQAIETTLGRETCTLIGTESYGWPEKCDKCGVAISRSGIIDGKWNYCPNCGARIEDE